MNDTQIIKDRLDIVQVIQEYVPLKKTGANYKACCPFHGEKSPSFMVHKERQIWHCFGCNKGGDVFSFLQEIENIEFPEALKILADKAGVTLQNSRSEVNKGEKNRLIDINTWAARFYHQVLKLPATQDARNYLKNRGLKTETIVQWKIGFVPDKWDLLTRFLVKKGFSHTDIVAAGLAIKKEDESTGRIGIYDRFRGRIMFPITNENSYIVGFTGRVLKETEHSGGKYINTPESPIFNKSRLLYGLDKAKASIKKQGCVILVEGQMDVIACHEIGITHTVASSGTALTIEQLRLLKRYTSTLLIAYDADQAGQNASKRGIDLALSEGLVVKIIDLSTTGYKDADECIRKNLPRWHEAVKQAQDVMSWYFAHAFTSFNVDDNEGKKKIVENIAPEISRLPSPIDRDYWLKLLASKLHLEVEILKEEVKNIARKQPINRSISPSNTVTPTAMSRESSIARALWSIFIKFPGLFGKQLEFLSPGLFSHDPEMLDLYETFKKSYTTSQTTDFIELILRDNPLAQVLLLQAAKDYPDWTSEQIAFEVSSLIKELQRLTIKKQRTELLDALALAEKKGDSSLIEKLLHDLQSLS